MSTRAAGGLGSGSGCRQRGSVREIVRGDVEGAFAQHEDQAPPLLVTDEASLSMHTRHVWTHRHAVRRLGALYIRRNDAAALVRGMHG